MRNKIKFIVHSGIYALALIAFSFTQGICNNLDNPELQLVVVNGDTITSKNIDRMIVKTHKKMDMSDKQSFDYDKLLTKSVNDLLILQESYALGLEENEYMLDQLKGKRKELVRKLYLSHAFQPDIVVTDKEINDYFTEYLVRYQFRSISLATIEDAQEVYELLQQGHRFDSLATERSLDHRRFKNGMHMVTFKKNVDEILLEQAEKMQVGEYSKPVVYKNFYSIIKFEKKLPADYEKFDTFKDKIKDSFIEQKKEVAWNNFIKQLLLEFPVSVDSLILEEIKADQAKVLQVEFRQGNEKPALKINDEYFISDNQLRTEVSHSTMNSGTTPFDIILVNSINKKQEELLCIYSAVKNGYWDSTRVVDWYYNELDSSLIELYLNEMIVAKISFNSEEFETYYKQNSENFLNPDLFILEQMIIEEHDQAHGAESALKDGAQWSYILKKYNGKADDSGDKNEWIYLQNFPDNVSQELEKLQPGQTTSSFETAGGFVIFKVKDRKKGGVKSIEEVDMEIREVMFQRKFKQQLDEHLDKLKNNSEIVYFDNEINKYFGKDK